MPDKTVSSMTLNDLYGVLADGVSSGVKTALAQHDSDVETHTAMMKQHSKVTGEDKKNDPLVQISESIGQISENNNAIANLFKELSSTLSIMSVPKKTDDIPSGSSLSAQASSLFSNDMTLSSSVPMPSGSIGSAFRNFYMSNGVSSQAPSPVDTSQAYQQAINAPMSSADKTADASDRKALMDEEDRAFKNESRSLMPKLNRAIDLYLESKNSSVNNGSSAEDGIASLLAMLAAGAAGFVGGYLGNIGRALSEAASDFGKMWSKGVSWLKDSSLGKKASELGKTLKSSISSAVSEAGKIGKQIKMAFSSGLSKLGELKSSFTGMINGWKTSMKESVIGKAASVATDALKKTGSFLSSVATKVGNGIKSAANVAGSAIKTAGKSVASGAKMAAKAVASSGIGQKTIKAAKLGAKIGRKVPVIQAVSGLADTAVNTYKVAKSGGNISDIMSTAGAGLVDTLSDTLLVPELINAAGGAIAAAQSGKGLGGILKGAGAGLIKQRDANDISIGTGLMANIQNFVGNGTETSRRVASAYNRGLGYDAAGVQTVSGAAGGFGHSAALYVPKGYGSMENVNTPNANVVDNMPNIGTMSEADRLKAYTDGIREGVKAAMLSPEVQEANAKTARDTGAAINGQLFGG